VLRVEARRLRATLQSLTAPAGVPAILLDAAQRLMPLDRTRAKDAFAEALQACLTSWQLTADTTPADVARAALESGVFSDADDACGLMQQGFALLFEFGYHAAFDTLRAALTAATDPPTDLTGMERWPTMAAWLAASLWDADAGLTLVHALETHEREHGALEALRLTLGSLGHYAMWKGDFAAAHAAHAESTDISAALGEDPFAWDLMKIEVLAWQGDSSALTLGQMLIGDVADAYGAGAVAHIGRSALVVLHLAHGRYRDALDVAWPSFVDDFPAVGSLMLPSIVEAAMRCDERDAAGVALERLATRASTAGTPWALGVLARARALAADDDSTADDEYRESIDQLRRSPLLSELARSELVYGEWLRRQARIAEAREHLGEALTQFADMGAHGF
jgi:hypothetical protein